ncbi:MAG: hypothetical protein AAF721_32125 [Myxococcota bacterium]
MLVHVLACGGDPLVSVDEGSTGSEDSGATEPDLDETGASPTDDDADDETDGESGEVMPCMPGEQAACYDGPDGTEDIGLCQAGQTTCTADGTWGPCEGAVEPAAEDCATDADEDCDGQTPACARPSPWQVTVTGSGDDRSVVVPTADGGVDVVFTTDSTDFSPAPGVALAGDDVRIIVVHYAADGAYASAEELGRTIGTVPDVRAARSDDGTLVVAGTPVAEPIEIGDEEVLAGRPWVAQYDADRAPSWVRSLPTAGSGVGAGCDSLLAPAPHGLTLRASDGAVAVSSVAQGSAELDELPFADDDPAGSGCNYFVTVFDADGVPTTARTIGTTAVPLDLVNFTSTELRYAADDGALLIAGNMSDGTWHTTEEVSNAMLLASLSPEGEFTAIASVPLLNALFSRVFDGPEGTVWWLRVGGDNSPVIELRDRDTGEIVAARTVPGAYRDLDADRQGRVTVRLSYAVPVDLGRGELVPQRGAQNWAVATYERQAAVLLPVGIRTWVLPDADAGWRSQLRRRDQRVFARLAGPIADADLGLGPARGATPGQDDTLVVALPDDN